MKIKYFFLLIGIFCCLNIFSQRAKQPHLVHALAFDIDAGLSLNGTEIGNFSYCLHLNGKILDSAFVKKARPFMVKLEPNEVYTMSFHKEGFIDRYIIINTHIHNEDIIDDFYYLAFEVELNPDYSLKKDKYLDHPVAVIKYVKKKKIFDFSNKYHNEIHHVSRHVIVND